MLDGWYCRTIKNQNTAERGNQEDDAEPNVVDDSDESQDLPVSHMMPRVDYKIQYNTLKKKLKFLLYENEFFQDALRSSQRRLLKVTRDRTFLLDRLLQYEKPEISSSESDETESSDDDSRSENPKKRKHDSANSSANNSQGKGANPPKKKKQAASNKKLNSGNATENESSVPADGHMTAEEVERHLQSRQSLMELVPERAPATVPNEMFSNEPSLDSESVETSPSNVGEECGSIHE